MGRNDRDRAGNEDHRDIQPGHHLATRGDARRIAEVREHAGEAPSLVDMTAF